MRNSRVVFAGVVVLVSVLTGCGGGKPKPPASGAGATHDDEHKHDSLHGGIVNAIGDHHVEFVLDVPTKKISVHVSGSDGRTPAPIPAHPIPLQAKPEGAAEFVTLTLKPVPHEKDPAGMASRFEALAEELAAARAFEAFLRVTVGSKQYRTAFQVVPGQKAHAAKSYRCPMNCEKGRVYPQKGKCPKCKMELAEFKDGAVEHADHAAKHGGVFFMAADNWHHVEGALPAANEFRLYLYDNFTKPIKATPYSGTAEIVRLDEKGDELGKPVTLQLEQAARDEYLIAKVPESMKFPLAITVRVNLKEGERPTLFNFTFDKVTASSDHKH